MIVTGHDASGRLLFTLETTNPDDIPLNFPDGWLEGHHEPDTVYAVNGQPTPRPALSLPAPVATVGADWTVQGVPAGTTFSINGVLQKDENNENLPLVIEDGWMVLIFPMAGAWEVELHPPFPWREATCIVEVTS